MTREERINDQKRSISGIREELMIALEWLDELEHELPLVTDQIEGRDWTRISTACEQAKEVIGDYTGMY